MACYHGNITAADCPFAAVVALVAVVSVALPVEHVLQSAA